MTDRERWLTCTDPAAMLAALGDAADERRCELFVEAIRATNFPNENFGENPSNRWGFLASYWCGNREHGVQMKPPANAPDLIRCLWPPPMMERERDGCKQCDGRGGGKQSGMGSIPRCRACDGEGFTFAPLIDPRWRTPTVMELARKARGERRPAFSGRSTNGQNIHSFHFAKNCGEVEIMHSSIRLKVGDRFDLVLDEEDRIGRYKKHWYGLLVPGETHAYQFTTDELSGTPPTGPNPELMPIMADALMDLEVGNEIITDHLRCGVHVAGECWVIGALLDGW